MVKPKPVLTKLETALRNVYPGRISANGIARSIRENPKRVRSLLNAMVADGKADTTLRHPDRPESNKNIRYFVIRPACCVCGVYLDTTKPLTILWTGKRFGKAFCDKHAPEPDLQLVIHRKGEA